MKLSSFSCGQNAKRGRVCIGVGWLCLVVTYLNPCKPVEYRYSGSTVCIFSPQCESGTSNVTCVIVSVTVYSEQKCLSLLINVSESNSNFSSMTSQSVTFSPYSHTTKYTSTKFGTQQTQHLQTVIQALAVPGLSHVIALRGK
jgi:hypothetical protein